MSAILDGYHTDLNETFVVGKNVSKQKKDLIKATHDSLFKAIAMCKPGTFYRCARAEDARLASGRRAARRGSRECARAGSDAVARVRVCARAVLCGCGCGRRDLGGVITKHINGCGFQVDKTYCGHGIGEWFHCAPNIPHYAGNKAKFTMKAGHIFTIEPMVNMGTWKDTHWLDGWTAVTKDGLPSAQFEHTLLVNETGVEILTARLPTSPPLWWEAEAAEQAAAGPAEIT